MKRLFIAEKPNLAQVIAQALGNPQYKDGYIICGDDVVSYCVGHLLKIAPPEHYNPAYKNWSKENLHMKLRPVQHIVIERTAEQFEVLARLIPQADEIVHAGDPDEEGQLLVDEVLAYCCNTAPVKRVLINDLNPEVARKALSNVRDNADFQGLSKRAYARSVADYLYGISVTRAYTIAAREKGHDAVISVGRVQTPILGMIVRRYLANKNHKEAWFWQVRAHFAGENTPIIAPLVIPEGAPVDDKGRIVQESYAAELAGSCRGKTATVTAVKIEPKTKAPPLPFALLDLQVKMSRLYGIKSEDTLAITQTLREKHKAITYNRSDCRYLNSEQFSSAPATLRAISSSYPELKKFFEQADSGRKSKAFNDDKTTAHTGIIPTEKSIDVAALTTNENRVYRAIVEQYLVQFLPDKGFNSALAEFELGDYKFRVRAIRNTESGWSALLTEKEDSGEQETTSLFDELARLKEGDNPDCIKADVQREKTSPPPIYTEASLLEDLRRVARYVEDPRIKQLLIDRDSDKDDKEQGGIGTPATRGTIISLLEERGFYSTEKGKIIPTDLGISLIQALPAIMTTPDMTALWHEQQKMIEAGELDVDTFLDELETFVSFQVDHVDISRLKVTVHSCECGGRYVRRKGEKGAFWGCNHYPECRNAVPDRNGQPDFTAMNFDAKCPKCKSKMKYGTKACNCTNENCKYVLWSTQFNKALTITQITDLLAKGKTREIKGFKNKAGKKFDAALQIEKDGSVSPVFNNKRK
ncbi:type IA DNA topoisomerase [Pantoea agglomerans]|uniref:type IA DNA topoisomerase n=1 Tax=Enterobacter agglomerans TaxID=549 RepID=UPI00241335EE|nr:type IA DNA topoisomerase [Pantoea agglomerans]